MHLTNKGRVQFVQDDQESRVHSTFSLFKKTQETNWALRTLQMGLNLYENQWDKYNGGPLHLPRTAQIPSPFHFRNLAFLLPYNGSFSWPGFLRTPKALMKSVDIKLKTRGETKPCKGISQALGLEVSLLFAVLSQDHIWTEPLWKVPLNALLPKLSKDPKDAMMFGI